MSEQKKKTYTPEFKEDAVRLITEQGYKVTEAARNLGNQPQRTDTGGKGSWPPRGRTPSKVRGV